MQTLTVADLLRDASLLLGETSSTPRLDAELLLAYVLGLSRARLLAERQYSPSAEQQARFAQLLARRVAQEPVAYLVGRREFYRLDFAVDRRVLVPRPETELLVELALGEAQRIIAKRSLSLQASGIRHQASALTIADIGTGSGAIAVALAVHLPNARLYAVDLSADALAVAEQNVARHGVAERVTLLHGDLLASLPAPVDLLVSNPPYTVLAEVEPQVRAHEPWLALAGGPDGAAVYRRLVAAAPAYLRPAGALLLEIGAWQAELVLELLREALPRASTSVHQDLAGRDRVVRARLQEG